MKSNVTDMYGNPVNPEGDDEFDTYKVRFYDLDEEDGNEFIHTVFIKAAPIMTQTYIGFATDTNSVELLIPFERLVTLQKVATAEENPNGETVQ